MTSKKKLGIWMDHSHAHIMDCTSETIGSIVLDSVTLKTDKQAALGSSESQEHNKEQRHQSAYYHKLIDEIKNYDDVLLFGPTEAKSELFNLIKAEHKYEHIKVEVKNSDKISFNEQQSIVKAHFSNN